jgi:hypothetical protein
MTPNKKPPRDEDELPICKTVGVVQLPDGRWAAVYQETQGTRVVAKEVLTDAPCSRAAAVQKGQVEYVFRIANLRKGAA